MTIIQIILVVVVIALIVGPFMALRPNPEQQRKERVRMAARTMGLSFRITRLPKLPTASAEEAAIACYFLQPNAAQLLQPEWLLRRTDYTHEGNFYAEWDWLTASRPTEEVQRFLTSQMLSLPRDVKAIGAGPGGTCAYWQEKGDEAVLADLLDLLNRIAALENTKIEADSD